MTNDNRRPDEAIHVKPWPDGSNAFDEDDGPHRARPMFSIVECTLIAGMLAVAAVCLWIGLTWGGR